MTQKQNVILGKCSCNYLSVVKCHHDATIFCAVCKALLCQTCADLHHTHTLVNP